MTAPRSYKQNTITECILPTVTILQGSIAGPKTHNNHSANRKWFKTRTTVILENILT